MTRIKICGLTRKEDIEAVNRLRPDFIGFVFAESRRQVSPKQAALLKAGLSPSISAAGVFVDEDPAQIASLVHDGVIDLVQLHGQEDAAYVNRLKSMVSCPLIKALRVQEPGQISDAQRLAADYLLLDTFVPGQLGGSGKTFDWSIIPKLGKPFFLAGGLTPENAAEACRRVSPFAVDVSSGVETGGQKDPGKIGQLIQTIRGDSPAFK